MFELNQIPTRVNEGPWFTAYTREKLLARLTAASAADERIVLPVCSLGTPASELEGLGTLVLPPLYHEAMDNELKSELLTRIRQCFPFFEGTALRRTSSLSFEVTELPRREFTPPATNQIRIAAFSVDTAVEEHGPHLPLATDTIQSYAVLRALAESIPELQLIAPVDHGHLTWGLPYGLSIDLTPPLLTRYVCGFSNALQACLSPDAMYVVDVHGSIVHRNAIQEGLRQSCVDRFAFRWLHEPLVEFAGDRGDQHAGGVETALVELVSRDLMDAEWWPGRVDELEAKQMTLERAVELHSNLADFVAEVEAKDLNGIVGSIRNYFDVDANQMMTRMVDVARWDVESLLESIRAAS